MLIIDSINHKYPFQGQKNYELCRSLKHWLELAQTLKLILKSSTNISLNHHVPFLLSQWTPLQKRKAKINKAKLIHMETYLRKINKDPSKGERKEE